MKVMTLFGTRPEIIRLSRVIEHLDRFCEQILVHTGQNYDPNLSDIFFRELGLRQPDIHMGIRADSFAGQIGAIMAQSGALLIEHRPDRLLILGDTNSGLAAVIAARMGIPVFHMEAGNRCYDDRVPEEINRRVIDHSSTILMPYTQRSKENLVREGIEGRRVYVTGNPIREVITHYASNIQASDIHSRLGIEPGKFILVTMHRAENVDVEPRLKNLTEALIQVQRKYGYPVICSLHPRTKDKMQQYGVGVEGDQVRFVTPLGFFDFVALEQTAFCALSDSGTVQEECCIFKVPNVTIRDVTERPETIECGSNMLSGCEPDVVLRCLETVLAHKPDWTPPQEYLETDVSSKVARIVLGYHHECRA
ncbi:MAG: UDP-N-acetylglucosamine 2-epimerase (non-hydrolyzing) [Anaerolineae bacterium]|nr:UDP-N-acetylglucosamine 2-epimerase (non-hydrolyzing) [Anaerolineae bacterium]